jgi:hypothetical protein
LDFIFENDVNIPSNSDKQKNFILKNWFFDGLLKVNDENSRIRIRILVKAMDPDPAKQK